MKIWPTLVYFFWIQSGGVNCQYCEGDLPMPKKSLEDRDTSGLRPDRQPPIPVGGSVRYQCPQMKSIKGKTSFTVKCNDMERYEFPKDLATWGECQCSQQGDLTAQCPGLTYNIKYRLVCFHCSNYYYYYVLYLVILPFTLYIFSDKKY